MLSASSKHALLTTLASALGEGEPVSVPDPYVAGGHVHLLRVDGSPAAGLSTWVTLGLADLDWSDVGFAHRVEILMTGPSDRPEVARALAVLAGHARAHRWLPLPGFSLRNGLARAGLAGPPHLYVTYPFAWPELRPIEAGRTKVFPVLAVPVHEGELALRMSEGEEAFEEHLSRHDVAIWDLGRAPTA